MGKWMGKWMENTYWKYIGRKKHRRNNIVFGCRMFQTFSAYFHFSFCYCLAAFFAHSLNRHNVPYECNGIEMHGENMFLRVHRNERQRKQKEAGEKKQEATYAMLCVRQTNKKSYNWIEMEFYRAMQNCSIPFFFVPFMWVCVCGWMVRRQGRVTNVVPVSKICEWVN